MPPAATECCAYLDIETTSLSPSDGELTVIGLYLAEGKRGKLIQLVGDEISATKLDEAMEEVANFYERETDEAIRILTSLLEPLMILVMGAVVGFIVIAMLLPMFELNLAVK